MAAGRKIALVMRQLVLVAAVLAFCTPAQAEDPALVAAAKREGSVVWYTTQIVDQFARPAAAAFEKLYPGIRVTLSRTNATTAAIKILNENRAGKNQSDVFDGTVTVVPLKKDGYVLKYIPDAVKSWPAVYRDPEGYWVSTNIYVLTPAYNTRLIAPGTEPKTYQALLNPEFRGKMLWGVSLSSSAAVGFIGTVLDQMGEAKGMDYLRALRKQNIAGADVSARQILDQVIAGEYAIALQIFNHHAVISAKKGAPVKWIPMQPATGVLSVVSIPKAAPHPNAAKLFEDFLVSPAGQKVYQQAYYLPADPQIPALDPELKPEDGQFRSRFFSPEETAAKMPHWKQVYDELFR
ncbi:MAG TPA: extracellular solute-binding protein [Micropepsaceae bacterium]|nr:extracellular solute-binding protein [Micropepsaceae bacterium]